MAEAIRRMVSDKIPTSRHHGGPKLWDAPLAGLLVRSRRCKAAKLIGIAPKTLRIAAEAGMVDAIHRFRVALGSSAGTYSWAQRQICSSREPELSLATTRDRI